MVTGVMTKTQSPKGWNCRVRKRQSYERWTKLLSFLEEPHTPAEVLEEIYKQLDGNNAFGSYTASQYAKESLKLAIEDRRTCGVCILQFSCKLRPNHLNTCKTYDTNS